MALNFPSRHVASHVRDITLFITTCDTPGLPQEAQAFKSNLYVPAGLRAGE